MLFLTMTSVSEWKNKLQRFGNQLRLVGWLSVSQLIGWGTFYYAFTLFNKPMTEAFGWSSSEINLALTVGFVTWATMAPFAGSALDRFGGKKVMSFGSLAGVLALLTWAHSTSLPLLYGSWVLMGIAMACALYEPAFFVLTKTWPGQYKRVITWLTLAGGFASTIFIPLIDYSIATLGWQSTLLAMAALNLGIVLPIHWWKLPDTKHTDGVQSSENKRLLDVNLFKESSFKPRTFWGLNLWFVIFNSVATGITFLFIPLLSQVGTEQSTLILSFSVIGPMQVLGRFILMWLGNSLHSLRIGVVVTLLASAGIASATLFPQSWAALLLFAAFFGTSKGIMTIIKGTAVADQMDLSVYARTNGWLSLFSMLFKAITPAAVATLWTVTGDPLLTLSSLSLLSITALLGIWLVRSDST